MSDPPKKNVFYGMRMSVFSLNTNKPITIETNGYTNSNIDVDVVGGVVGDVIIDMNSIKKKYQRQSSDIQPFMHTMKKGIVERANMKTGGCKSCGR